MGGKSALAIAVLLGAAHSAYGVTETKVVCNDSYGGYNPQSFEAAVIDSQSLKVKLTHTQYEPGYENSLHVLGEEAAVGEITFQLNKCRFETVPPDMVSLIYCSTEDTPTEIKLIKYDGSVISKALPKYYALELYKADHTRVGQVLHQYRVVLGSIDLLHFRELNGEGSDGKSCH